MKSKKLFSVIMAAAMLPVSGLFAVPSTAAGADVTVRLEPSEASPFNNGSFEGWGTSLCWWANRLGYSDKLTSQAAEAFFSDEGLSLDIARYNIGGGDDPGHDHITRSDSKVPGVWETFELSEDGNDVVDITYDMTNDQNQLNIAKAALEANPDIYFEGFSNSPPYFMTNSGCSSGADPASSDNLKPEMYDDFGKYIADATKLLKDNGIVFESYSPMNEPDTDYWGVYSDKQEGCHYDPGESQSKAIVETRRALDEAGLTDVIVAGMDETSIDSSVDNLDLLTDEAKEALGRIDTHTYSGSRREALKNKAVDMGKTLWMSEVDGGWDGFGLADRIILDMNGMQPAAWIMWDIVDKHKDSEFCDPYGNYREANTTCSYTESLWGVGMADHDTETLVLTGKYYMFGQFTKYIEPGDTIIASSDRTLAAYNKQTGDIKIVVSNSSSSDVNYEFDLSAFTSVGTDVREIRSDRSGSEQWAEITGEAELSGKTLSAPAKAGTVTTFVIDGEGETNYASITGGFDELCIGETHQLNIITNISYDTVEWSTSDSEVASITSDGVITPLTAGDVTVYANLGSYTASRTFTVPPYQRIRISDYDTTGTYSWQYSDSSDYLKAGDGDLSTYFDGLANGYVMYDCKDAYTLDLIKFAPRNGYEDRIAGGAFQGSNDGLTWTDIYKVPASVPALTYTEIESSEFLTDVPFRWFRYTNSAAETNIAEIALYGEKYEGEISENEPQVLDIAGFTDNFEGETNIFNAAGGTLDEDGSQVFDTQLSRYGHAFAPVKSTAEASLPEAVELSADQIFRLKSTMFAGWENSGRDNTLAIKDENGNELVAVYITGGGYTLQELRIGGENVLSGTAISQSRCATSGNRTGANGWFDDSQPFKNNVDFNKTLEITISGSGDVSVSLTGGLENISYSGTLSSPVNIKTLQLEGDYNSSRHRVVSYDNFDADIITYPSGGQDQEYTATIPDIDGNTVYFVDCDYHQQSNKYADTYEAAKAKAESDGGALMNDTGDALKSDKGTWGRIETSGLSAKGTDGLDLSSAYDTGYYNNTNPIQYEFTLPAGTYSVTTGHREWWTDVNGRKTTVTVADADENELASADITLSGTDTARDLEVGTFTLDAETVVTLRANPNDSRNGAVLSWIRIDKAEVIHPTAPPESDSVLISLDFDGQDLSSGSPYGAAEAVGSVGYGEGEDGTSCLYLDGSGDGYVKLTDANGDSLFAGRDEITVSFKVKPATSDTSWWLFAASNDNEQKFEQEHYIGLLGQSVLTAERYNSGSRPVNASAQYNINEWNDVIVSFGADSTSIYINGTKVSEQASEYSLADILGTLPVAYIGHANWGAGEYANGYIDDFIIYDMAVPSIDLGDLSDVQADITLPSSIGDNCTVTWSSSDSGVISADGTVTRPASGTASVTLTAELTMTGEEFDDIVIKQTFEASVPGLTADAETFRIYIENGEARFAFDSLDNIPYDVYTALYDDEGVLIGIKKNAVSGSFTLPGYGTYRAVCYVWDDKNVSKHEPIRKTLNYSAELEEEKSAYLFVHFMNSEGDASCEQIYFSVSEDGQTWTTLNDSSPVLTSTVGEDGVRDPYILRGEDGKFFIIATNLSIYGRRGDPDRWTTCQESGSRSIVIWESNDLVNWSKESLVEVAADNAGCTWAPEAVYDPEKDMYMVFWASKISDDGYSKQRVYRSYTEDFKTFTEPEIYIETPENNIDTTITSHEGVYYRFTKNESRSSIIMESSTSLSGGWKDVATYNLGDMTGYEGPAVYKLNGEDSWCLLLDYYSRGQGYKPFITDDISTGIFTQASDFTFDGTYRHGTVLPITAEEYSALVEKY